MTNEEKKRINQLRSKGHSYTYIADVLSLPVSTIKSFCWRNTQNTKTKKETVIYCKNCGTKTQQKEACRPRKFCSDKCRYAWWQQNRDKSSSNYVCTIICENCKKEFVSYTKSKRKYCSHDCYIKHRFGG